MSKEALQAQQALSLLYAQDACQVLCAQQEGAIFAEMKQPLQSTWGCYADSATVGAVREKVGESYAALLLSRAQPALAIRA